MINLRYHIVSLTAVFLALGIGVMLGGTYLDKYTVDQLDKNIAAAERRIAEVRDENRGLEGDLAQARARELSLLADGGSRLLRDELDGVPVLVVLGPGVDSAADDGVRLVLSQAGADVRGTLVLRDQMLFGGDEVDRGLADALGSDAASPAALRAEVYGQLEDAMRAAGQAPEVPAGPDGSTSTTVAGSGGPGSGAPGTSAPATTAPATTAPGGPVTPTVPATTTTTTVPTDPGQVDPGGRQPEVVTELLGRGYLALEAGPGHDGDPILEQQGYRYVFVTTPGTSSDQLSAFARLLPRLPAEALPAVVVSPRPPEDDETAGSTLVGRVREDTTLRSLYSTVDDVDDFSGMVALVFVLDAVPGGATGHYGQGPGAQAVLPSGR